MANQITTPRVEDIMSVGSRINWGAILGGSLVALAIYFMLSTLGAAVGMTISDRIDPKSLQLQALIWAIGTFAVAVFVGGVMTSVFTIGENKVEAVFYGVIMWAFLFALTLAFAATGVRSAANGMVGMAQIADNAARTDWEIAARNAGVPNEAIDEWRRKANTAMQDPHTEQQIKDAATRLSWWAFGGTWLSMFTAALGAWVGSGPTFRIVTVPSPNPIRL